MSEDKSQSWMQVIPTLYASHIEQAARIDGLEILLVCLGNRLGIDPDELVSQLRVAQSTAHQKRLEAVEDRNPSTAAGVDNRVGNPQIDEEMLRKMDLGDSGRG